MPKEMERTAPVSAPLKTKNGQKPPLHHKGGAIESVARNLDSDIEKLQLLGDTNRLDECTHRLAIDNDRDSSKLGNTLYKSKFIRILISPALKRSKRVILLLKTRKPPT